jgi:hypothetical protein
MNFGLQLPFGCKQLFNEEAEKEYLMERTS